MYDDIANMIGESVVSIVMIIQSDSEVVDKSVYIDTGNLLQIVDVFDCIVVDDDFDVVEKKRRPERIGITESAKKEDSEQTRKM